MPESYPSDSEINALSGTADAEQDVPYIPTGQSPYYTSFYKMQYRLLDVARRAGDLRVFKDGDLTFGVRPGRFLDGDSPRDFSGAAGAALADNAVNYIYINAGGALSVDQGGFPTPSATPHIPLATITTSAGQYGFGDIVDYRGRAMLTVCSGPVARAAKNAYNLDSGLRAWRRKTALGGVLDVVLVGNSISAGYNAADRSTQGFAKLIAAGLKARYGDGGTGIVTPLNNGVITPALSFTGNWGGHTTYNFFGSTVATGFWQPQVPQGQNTATLTAAGTTSWTVYLWELGRTGAASLSVDGGTGTNVGHAGTGSGGPSAATVNTPGTTAVLTDPTSATLLLMGIAANKGTSGVRFHHLAYSGKSSADVTACTKALIDLIAPALTILPFTTNEYKGAGGVQQTLASYSANLTGIAAEGLKSGSVLLVGEPMRTELLTIPQTAYAQTANQGPARTNDCAFIDIGERWLSGAAAVTAGLLDADGTHPVTAGHADMAAAILNCLT